MGSGLFSVGLGLGVQPTASVLSGRAATLPADLEIAAPDCHAASALQMRLKSGAHVSWDPVSVGGSGRGDGGEGFAGAVLGHCSPIPVEQCVDGVFSLLRGCPLF